VLFKQSHQLPKIIVILVVLNILSCGSGAKEIMVKKTMHGGRVISSYIDATEAAIDIFCTDAENVESCKKDASKKIGISHVATGVVLIIAGTVCIPSPLAPLGIILIIIGIYFIF